MQLRELLSEISGLRYMIDRLDIKSKPGQRMLLAIPFVAEEKELNEVLDRLQMTLDAYKENNNQSLFEKLAIKLSNVKDIAGTIKQLEKHAVLNDIELFEIKYFAILFDEIKTLLSPLSFLEKDLPHLEKVIQILDPENKRLPSFYIYNAYHPELGYLRKELSRVEATIANNEDVDIDPHLQILSKQFRQRIIEIEDEVRENLSAQLSEFAANLSLALNAVAEMDILLAKAKLAVADQLVKPAISTNTTHYEGVFYPELKESLTQNNRRYQSIDIDIYNGACLITGANMGGKTVLLKTLGLSQALCQLGFFVPAQKAQIALVSKILFSVNDSQSVLSGLSSYAAEMTCVNEMIQLSKQGKPLLLLIDELARTTNPTEGRAIVAAVANYFNDANVKTIITTHYGNLNTQCRRLRVKGFVENEDISRVNLNNIGDYMDYALTEDDDGDVPHEAVRIAQIMKFDDEVLSSIKQNIKK